MIDNTQLLQDLFSQKRIALENASFLSVIPDALPKDWDFERVEGMLLGLAIGDALGNTTEAQLPHIRVQNYGEIRDYLSNKHAQMRNVGLPSDDSQMAFWTLEQIIADGGLVPDHLAAKFTKHQIYGIGSAVNEFIRAYKDQGKPWMEAGQSSAGNGALMRIAPVLIPHLRQPSPALWADAALAGMVTHNDQASNSCCIAFTYILWECLRMEQVPSPMWWVEKFTAIASQLEGNTHYQPRQSGIAHQGPLWQFVEQEVSKAIKENWSILDASTLWYSGAYLLETMPCALFILSRYADKPEEAIVRAVNDVKDNDTVAAIVGAAVGALHGRAGLPARWISGLLGRTSANDDWHIFELIEDAKQVFWQSDQQPDPSDRQAILNYLPVFEQPDFKPGEWITTEGSLPYYNYSSEVLNFLRVLGEHNFIIRFPWPDWEEGKRLIGNPELLQRSNLLTLQKLMTKHVRADRFSEGHLAQMFETGEIVMILRRLAEIQIYRNDEF
jgi:ADP-ribosyl-[dinitrogen reductase] hydrolase